MLLPIGPKTFTILMLVKEKKKEKEKEKERKRGIEFQACPFGTILHDLSDIVQSNFLISLKAADDTIWGHAN